MKKPTPGKHYVEILAAWAGAAEKNEQIVRLVMDPRHGLIVWLEKIIEPYYSPELNRPFGCEKGDFVHDCVLRLYRWAHNNVPTLLTEFDDEGLMKFTRTIARHHRIDLFKLMRRFLAEEDDRLLQRYTVVLEEARAGSSAGIDECALFDAYPWCEAVLRKMRTIIISFRQSLSRGSKIRRLHTAIACYYHRFTRPQELTKYCYIMNTYRQKHTHLHPHLLAYLRRQCPGVPQNVLNSRIRYLRKLFDGFIDRNGYADFMACWF